MLHRALVAGAFVGGLAGYAEASYIILFSMEGFGSEEIKNMMSFVCDLNLDMSEEGE